MRVKKTYSAIRLDLLRIMISCLLLCSPELRVALSSMESVSPLAIAPFGFGWVVDHVGPHFALGKLSLALIYGGALLGLLGWYARGGLALAAIGQFYLIGWLQMRGATVHCHHLLWLTVALAASPCSDVLRLGHSPVLYIGRRYRDGLLTVWAILAMIFFFPGVFKLILGGRPWFSGETFYYTTLWKAAQYWDQPLTLSLSSSLAYAPLSWGAMLFELSAPLILIWYRRTGLFLGLALSFHLGTSLMLNIHFTNLWPCYIALVPWESGLTQVQAPVVQRTEELQSMRPLLTLLLIGVLYAGVTMNLNGWPFACYPTFHQKISHKMPLMSVVVQDQRGQKRRLDYHQYMRPNNRAWGENWRLAGFYAPIDEGALKAFGRSKITPLLKPKDNALLFYRSSINLLSDEVKDHKLLCSVKLEELR